MYIEEKYVFMGTKESKIMKCKNNADISIKHLNVFQISTVIIHNSNKRS